MRGRLDSRPRLEQQSVIEGCRAGDRLRLDLAGGDALRVDCVLLATGFMNGRPGGRLGDALIESAELPGASCGFPEVDPFLRWHPRVFVSGALAELEIGPAARNIAGARRAGDRLIRGIRNGGASPAARALALLRVIGTEGCPKGPANSGARR